MNECHPILVHLGRTCSRIREESEGGGGGGGGSRESSKVGMLSKRNSISVCHTHPFPPLPDKVNMYKG